jgi:hypothetical protein
MAHYVSYYGTSGTLRPAVLWQNKSYLAHATYYIMILGTILSSIWPLITD